MITKVNRALSAYKELLQTGGITCTAEGEYVLLDVRGNLAGDILVFIGPKNNTVSAAAGIYDLIQSDSTLQRQREFVLKSLSQKYKGLSLLPESLVWIINIIISTLYTYINSNSILKLFGGEIDLAEILNLLPIVIILVLTPVLSKTFGFKVLKPFMSFIGWTARFFRKVRNRKISFMQI